MIRETLFKEKQIFPVFFQIPSAVYVWTQEWCSFQMERSHFDKMTSITTPDSKVKNALGLSDKRSEETNASWTKEHMTSNVFGCPDLWFQTHKGGSMSITMCIIETCREEQVSDREGSHLQCRFSLEQTWWSLCFNSPTGFHKERCGQKLWMMVSNITRSRDRRASYYGKSISRLWRCHVPERILDWD